MPGIKFLTEIENVGVPFSKEKLLEAQTTLTERIYAINESIYLYPEVHKAEKIIGEKFNPNSTAHLRTLFYNVLGLPVTKKTDLGSASTDKEVLDTLATMHPIPSVVKELRGLIKLKSTYIDKILAGIHNDGRLRASFHLHTTTSGRLSSSGKLNMQQLPREDKLTKGSMIHPDPMWCIFSQDLSTAEMYYAAVLSGDVNLSKIFESGGDFHSQVAKMVFKLNCPVEKVKELFPHLRQAAKAISFGILYGAGPETVAESAGCTMEEAQDYIYEYFAAFPQLSKWLKSEKEKILADGFTYSKLGRKRRVPSVFSVSSEERGHAARSAINFLIQSVASDVNLIAATKFNKWIKDNNIRAEVFALVHDSIIGAVHRDDRFVVAAKLKEFTQENVGVTLKSGHPIGVDMGFGDSYADCK
jgi:DNA polymerase I-like protein with 3'-5' exonuclease and polymerase domains